MFHWMLATPQRLKSMLPVEHSFLIRKCAHLVVSAHISLQVKHLAKVCEREKQGQLLWTTSPLWFWPPIRLEVHFCDKFLSFLCCGTSCFKNDFSSQCLKEPVSHFNPYCRIFSSILAGQRAQRLTSLPPVKASAISSIAFFDYTSWRSSATALLVEDLSLSQHVLRFSVRLQVPKKCLLWTSLPLFLDLAAASSPLIFSSFPFSRFLEPLG